MKTELRKEAERLSKLALEFAEEKIRRIRQTLNADMEAGKRDARCGIYDKWYRDNRTDEGLAYEAGWKIGRCELVEKGVELEKIQFI